MIARFRRYGIDAPAVPLIFLLVGLGLSIGGSIVASGGRRWAYWLVGYGVFFLVSCALYMHTTLRGKFTLWQRIFAATPPAPDAAVLDLGCGRGAVLLMLAQRLSDGSQATGIDLWKSRDQSGNDIAVTRRNADLEGVADKIHLHTADMMDLPFESQTFDYITASFSIHNIADAVGRRRAISEAWRVLRPGGSLIIADIRHTSEYLQALRSLDADDIHSYNAGARAWWGGPWVSTTVIPARKPTH